MNGRRWLLPAALAVLLLPGCQSTQSRRAALAAAEPSLSAPGESAPSVVQAPPPKTTTIVDRHPLLSKPREYYQSAGNNQVVKVTAATVVGIPAGIVGELKQIVVGRPPDPTY
jgi:hypothetical protein